MQFEYQVFGQVAFVPPDDPAHASIHKTKLMATGVDRLNAGKLKVPLLISLCMCKWCNKTARGSIDMNGNIDASLLLVSVQDIVDLLNGLIVACISAAQNHENTNGVLVD